MHPGRAGTSNMFNDRCYERHSPSSAVVKSLHFHSRGSQFQSLVGELRSCMLCRGAKKRGKKTMLGECSRDF